ncbi:thiamine phosphate synthase [Methanobrevibacter acididurans]|uniref:thiamine phosphate synthase n=1 Tax=Methanobrevibacter acididurans TaxID=120963 RepID=UPI0038FC7756
MDKDIDYSLYLVTNNKNKTEDEFLNIIEKAAKGGITMLQVREKELPLTEFLEIGKKVQKIAKKYNIPFIIDNNVAIAMDLEADGVHVGQTDIDAAEVRKVIGPDMLLGVSAQTVEQAKKAENDGADYIGSGAVFPSPTKPNAPHISLQDLKNIADSVNIPVVVIGGVNESNVKDFKGTNIEGICVVSAIMESKDPEFTSENLKKEFDAIK